MMVMRSTVKRLLNNDDWKWEEDEDGPPSVVQWQCDGGGGCGKDSSGSSSRRSTSVVKNIRSRINNVKANNTNNNRKIKNSYDRQRFILLAATVCSCLIIPLSEALHNSNSNPVKSMANGNTQQHLQPAQSSQMVQISNSYTSTNVKAGPPSSHNIHINSNNYSNLSVDTSTFPSTYNNNNDNHKMMKRISFLPNFGNFIFPSSSAAFSTPVKTQQQQQTTMGKRRRRIKPTNNNANNNKNNRGSGVNNTKQKNPRKKRKKQRRRPSKVSANVSPTTILTLNAGSNSSIAKPTMHPLRVLQTEISTLNKTNAHHQNLKNLQIINGTTTASFPYNMNNHNLQHTYTNDKYLSNHRLVDSITTNTFGINSQYKSNVSSGVVDNFNNIVKINSVAVPPAKSPVYIPEKKSKPNETIGAGAEVAKLLGNETTTVTLSPDLNIFENDTIVSTNRSALLKVGDVKVQEPRGSRSEGRSAMEALKMSMTSHDSTSRFNPEESKQLHNPSYFNHINDQIAEEGNQYEVTERFPGPYGRRPTEHQQGSESQMMHNHHYHPNNNNINNYRQSDTLTRPKLNSYYDANYYSAASNSHYYHANSHHDDYENEPPHGYVNHHHHPLGQERHPKQPQPYKGEHDAPGADTIMDRFEVFYKEYKLLTWVATLTVTGLALLCVLAYLYINNPPTEVVTARSKITEYLRDPSLLKFLQNLVDGDDAHGGGTRRRRKKNSTNAKEL